MSAKRLGSIAKLLAWAFEMAGPKTIIIAGGGTGGHIYPGVAIARALLKIDPTLVVHFVGSQGGLEEKIVPREGFVLHMVSVGKLHKSVGLLTRVQTLLKMPIALFQSLKILFTLKPVAVLGVGGFASGPMLLVASLFGYRTYIWEPNAMPGMANRLLSRFATETLLVFKEAQKYLAARKIRSVGIPVRFHLPAISSPPTGPFRILIFGGSQGAHAINKTVFRAIEIGGLEGIEVVHQTGPQDFARGQEVYKKAPKGFQVFEYLHDMKERYRNCDLVIARSGASTVAEIIACHKAAIFIPLPTAADDHQRKNAEVLEKKSAARMILQKDFTPEKFLEVVHEMSQNRDKIAELAKSVQGFAFENADQDIAEILLGRID
jgi:UDP-N-acetylglucosamine--N-acetylmuramyl-(pentapeptide) pyrophosphoryl-undecaprenol N-acetylglucosamine transferase